MPAPNTVPEFLDLVRRSQLLQDNKLDDVIDRHRTAGNLPQSIDQVANLLIREAQVTFFQAKQLKLGRYKRFTIGSKYRLLELIGAGGMGAVYLCEHTLMRRLVALKVLPVEKLEDESNKERFYREARAVAALDHPNIVRAYDIDTYEKLHFLVMEYVDGTSLQEVVARYILEKKLFNPVRAAHYIAQSAVGMQHAHEMGMVHRDIKPGNLLLDRSGVIKVLDMGLARFFNKQQDSVTEKYDHNCVLGTADYLAPEQAVSNMVDIRADIYALGGTLYFMLTGHTPFPDGTIAAKLVAHQTREPRPVESFRSDAPPGLLAVLRTMMAKDPNKRYQKPIEVADALSEWADQPITPPPAREMPFHCPLVQALAGPSLSGSGTFSPLARALFSPGQGVFARSNGGGSSRSGPHLLGGSTGSFSNSKSDSHSNAKLTRSDPNIAIGGPISTGRASAAPTVPLQAPSSSSQQPNSVKVAFAPPFRRTGFYILSGVLLTFLIVSVAIASYYLGKGEKNPGVESTKRTSGDDPIDEKLIPGAGDKILLPIETCDKTNQVQTVQFKVASISVAEGCLTLNSEQDSKSPVAFAVRIVPAYFQKLSAHEGSRESVIRNRFEGKMIRARGLIQRDVQSKSYYIEVQSNKQIVPVPE